MNSKFNTSYIGLRKDLLRNITGKNHNVLDSGCAVGTNGRFLKENGIAKYVLGVEFEEEMAKKASEILDTVLFGDIQDENLKARIPSDFFDYIILGDVLEHLIDPWTTLKSLETKLKDGGKIIISVPNSGHLDVIIHLLIKKTWPRNERGIFDKTHLRLFARKDIDTLITSSGLKIFKLERNYRYRDALKSKFPIHAKILKLLFPDLYTFQFIITAQKSLNPT